MSIETQKSECDETIREISEPQTSFMMTRK